MRWKIWFLAAIVLVCASHSSRGGCGCSSGGGASYNYLGDRAFDITIPDFNEFLRSSLGPSKAGVISSAGREERAARSVGAGSNLSLDLDSGMHAEVSIFPAGEEIFGCGKITSGNATEAAGAYGSLVSSQLRLDLVTQGGKLFRLEMAERGRSLSGNYTELGPKGEVRSGRAEGML
jgi:hypothetical protein